MENLEQIVTELKNGDTILYLGMGIFSQGSFEGGAMIPHDSNSLILALNSGRPMAPKLMYEYSRAAMDIEQRVGRKALEQKLFSIFSQKINSVATFDLVEKLKPKYIIDTNYDDTILGFYTDTPHSVILGKARLGAELDRFEIHEFDVESKKYTKITKEQLSLDNSVIFKPMGAVSPVDTFIISDADFVDWLTEAMGGFALPQALKKYREGKKYLMLGFSFDKDTQRMAANEITLALEGGYFVYDGELTKNGAAYLANHKMEQIVENTDDFVASALKILSA